MPQCLTSSVGKNNRIAVRIFSNPEFAFIKLSTAVSELLTGQIIPIETWKAHDQERLKKKKERKKAFSHFLKRSMLHDQSQHSKEISCNHR